MTDDDSRALADSRRTIESYEGFAAQYATLVDPVPPPDTEAALRRMLAVTGPTASVLEVGSGTGRDADFVESLGATVRRTDATEAFLDLQRARGRRVESLDLMTDPLGGPYDAVLALCVLIHIPRVAVDDVLLKIADALRPGGAFLVSMRAGSGETGGSYHTVYWSRDGFAERLHAAGLAVVWDTATVDSDGDHWLTCLAVTATGRPPTSASEWPLVGGL